METIFVLLAVAFINGEAVDYKMFTGAINEPSFSSIAECEKGEKRFRDSNPVPPHVVLVTKCLALEKPAVTKKPSLEGDGPQYGTQRGSNS